MSNLIFGKLKSIETGNCFPLELPIDNVSLLHIFSQSSDEEVNSALEYWILKWVTTHEDSFIDCLSLSIKNNFPALSALQKNNLFKDWSGFSEVNKGIETIVKEIFHRKKIFGEECANSLSEYNSISHENLKKKIIILPPLNDFIEVIKGSQIKNHLLEAIHNGSKYGFTFILLSDNKGELNPTVELEFKNNEIIFNKIHPAIVKLLNHKLISAEIHFGNRSLSMIAAKEEINSRQEALERRNNDFLRVKIGKKGARDFYLSLGKTSAATHGFISGTTGSGKSTFIKKLIFEIIKNYNEHQITIDLIDLKYSVEADVFLRHPNRVITGTLGIKPTFTEINNLFNFYNYIIDNRYQRIRSAKSKDIDDHNSKVSATEIIPYKIVFIDEAHEIFKQASSVMDNYKLSERIQLLLQKSRAAGVHFIFSSQSFRNSGFTDTTKEQMQLRLALRAGSALDSVGMVGDDSAFAIRNSPSENKFHLIYNSQCGNQEGNEIVVLDCLADDELGKKLENFEDKNYKIPILDFSHTKSEAAKNQNSMPAVPVASTPLEDLMQDSQVRKNFNEEALMSVLRLKKEIDSKKGA